MAFTNWTALKTKMLDDLSNGNTTVGEYQVDTGGTVRRMNFRSHQDWLKLFSVVSQNAATETGTVRMRTFAKQGGRG